MWLLVILAGGIEPAAVTDHFAAIEHNSYFDEHGKHVFDQLIYRSHEAIVDWRLYKCADQIPTGRRAIWFDGTCLRKVSATSVYRTWTQFDRELIEREQLPKEQRKELTRPPSRQRAKELIGKHDGRN